ncbi:MAG: TatD family hydrolase [Pseudomonadales bacterium]|nr:TatD family hydrolase [Pseudomonadales bacterium]
MPEATLAPLVDIGANLGHESFAHDLDAVLQRAVDAGLRHLLVTGTTASASQHALELAQAHPTLLSATAGVHPHEAQHCDEEHFAIIRRLVSSPQVLAVGETGLDFNRDYSPRPVQERIFEQHLVLAAESGKPMFLHQRDAHARFFPMLKEFRDALPRNAVVHCFTGERHELYDYLDLDLYVGITGWVCDERRGQHLLEFLHDIPRERLLLETDAPYLLPRSLRPKPKSRRNEPCHLTEVLRTVATAIGEAPEVLARQTAANAVRLFQIPEQDWMKAKA